MGEQGPTKERQHDSHLKDYFVLISVQERCAEYGMEVQTTCINCALCFILVFIVSDSYICEGL